MIAGMLVKLTSQSYFIMDMFESRKTEPALMNLLNAVQGILIRNLESSHP